MRRPVARTSKPRVAKLSSFPAPTRGWIANENLAIPTPGGAAVLENWFPTATGLRVRAGTELYATLGDASLTARSLFSYLNGQQRELFGATDTTIYDITNITTAFDYMLESDEEDIFVTDTGDTFGDSSTIGREVLTGLTGGNWVVVQFATSGGVFLFGVNGQDNAFLYDGTYFYPVTGTALNSIDYDTETAPFTAGQTLTGGTSGATATIIRVIDNGSTGTLWIGTVTGGPFQDNEALTDGSGGAAVANGVNGVLIGAITGVPTSSLSYVWPYKNRLWFVEKDSLDAWYLPIDAVAGPATKFPLGGVFARGGTLRFGATWSLDSGAEGGLSEQCIFVSSEGEVAVYQGSDPATNFTKVGVYRIGRPLGDKAHIRAGGDIVIATDIGFVPLSQAIQRDVAALSPGAVSYAIETAWNERVAQRSAQPWHCEIWPTKQMSVVALPTAADTLPEMFVANARTGAWALYTGWDGTCLEVFSDRLFYGSVDGKIIEAEVTGADQGAPYTATCMPLFSDIGSPASTKTAGMARAVLISAYPVNERVSVQVDFTIKLPAPPDSAPVGSQDVWGLGVWGQSVWSTTTAKQSYQRWQSVSGDGYAMAPAVQITSGSVPPLQVDLVRFELTTTSGDIGS